jgi:hypothetical protein
MSVQIVDVMPGLYRVDDCTVMARDPPLRVRLEIGAVLREEGTVPAAGTQCWCVIGAHACLVHPAAVAAC